MFSKQLKKVARQDMPSTAWVENRERAIAMGRTKKVRRALLIHKQARAHLAKREAA